MAKLDQVYDTETLPVSDRNFEPIPDGWFTFTISQADLAKTKDRTGSYIKIRLDVVAPSHQGRVIFSNINLRNASAKAEEIGQQQLGELLRAIGMARLEDTDQLIGRRVDGKVRTRRSKEYGDSNEIKGWRAPAGGAPAVSSMAPLQTQPPTAKKPPWAK